MKPLFYLLAPVLAPFVPRLVFKKLKADAAGLFWGLILGILVIGIVRLLAFVPHEKSPELSRVYDFLFYALAFAGRVFLSAGVIYLFLRFALKKNTSLLPILALVTYSFWPLFAIVATDTLFLPYAVNTGVTIAAELWHGLVLGIALQQTIQLSSKQGFSAAAVSLVLMLVCFDDVWGLMRLLP